MSIAAPTIADTGTWSLSVKLGLPILCAVVLICFLITVALLFVEDGWLLALTPALVVIGGVIGGLIGYYPYDAQYHQYRDVSGTVSQIGNRLIASGTDGGGSDQRFVVTLQGSPQQFGIDDTRASLLKVGDPVALRCIRQHDSGSSDDGYVCKWGKS